MWAPLALIPAAVALLAAGAAATAIRSSLLILGEEGLAEDAARGDGAAARLLAAVRDPSLRHPFSLWVAGAALKASSGLVAGAAALFLFRALGPWAGGFAAAGWILAFLLLLFILENLSARGAIGDPRRVLRWRRICLSFLGAAAVPARLLDSLGRSLFGDRYSPEALMDIRFGSEEGILDVIEEGAEHGTIDPTEERMIEGVLKFGELTVGEGMTPWPEVVTLREGTPLEEAAEAVAGSGFSSYPVLSRGGDEVVGILTARGLLRAFGPGGGGRPAALSGALLEKPLYVPESMKVSDLFRQFRRTRVQLAIAIDEHGRLRGVITVHDLIERIVGRLAEGTEGGEVPEWEKNGALSVPAATPVRVLRDEYGIGIPLAPSYETAGGFAMDCLQELPEGQVTFRAHGYRITVAETERFRIKRLRFEKAGATGTS